ncbi:response regulator [Vibrio sp. SCSIO 43140]|uniref:response regulator n=1 Tax=Vibrio sp. SCSIO 43140 TaxID=2819100 RepID=UPI002074BEE4|nr:response regulator [Vibrio sp. SCSIO 43140]
MIEVVVLRVLVVDDSEINFMVLESMISIYDTDVEHAHNINEAVHLLSNSLYDVVVLDIFLEDELGTDLFLKEGHPSPNMTYLSCSAEAGVENLHFQGHISKPFSNSQVEEVFSAIVNEQTSELVSPQSIKTELSSKFLKPYIRETLKLLKLIDTQVKTNDFQQARKSSHKLLGSSSLITSQHETYALIKDLHQVLQSNDAQGALITSTSSLIKKITRSVETLSE